MEIAQEGLGVLALPANLWCDKWLIRIVFTTGEIFNSLAGQTVSPCLFCSYEGISTGEAEDFVGKFAEEMANLACMTTIDNQ